MKALRAAAVAAALLSATTIHAASIDLSGDASGFLALYGFKNWGGSEPVFAPAGAPNWVGVDGGHGSLFPYFYDDAFAQSEGDHSGTRGVWTSIAVMPSFRSPEEIAAVLPENLRASLVIPEQFTTQSDYSSLSAGTITYDDSVLTGVGTEYIAAGDLALNFNNAGFSPFFSPYNTGGGNGNFQVATILKASDVTGTGLTFTDGVLSSIDLDANLQIIAQLWSPAQGQAHANLPTVDDIVEFPPFVTARPFEGSFSISGNTYTFDVNGQGGVTFIVDDSRYATIAFNRTGTIDAVVAVPEPSTYAMMGAGLAVLGLGALRRRRAAEDLKEPAVA